MPTPASLTELVPVKVQVVLSGRVTFQVFTSPRPLRVLNCVFSYKNVNASIYPIADGGEGTVETVISATEGENKLGIILQQCREELRNKPLIQMVKIIEKR